MRRFSQLNVLLLSAAGLMACNAPQAPLPAHVVGSASPEVRLTDVVERYWTEKLARPSIEAPDISVQGLADSLAAERRYLAEIAAVPRALLDADARETYDIFLRDRQSAIEGYTYPSELLPLNPYDSVPQRLAFAASSGKGGDWPTAADAFARWSLQAIANMRDGLRRGYTVPRSTVEQMLPWLAALGSESPSNPFFQVSAKAKILPAYRALHDFLQQEYLPRARSSVGLSALPLGEAWYASVVKREAGAEWSPKTVHDLGVADVERLRGHLQALLAGTAYAGNLAGFLENLRHDPHNPPRTADALLASYEELKVQVVQSLPMVVAEVPIADFQIRAVETYAQTVTPPLLYWPGSVPVLYANTADLDAHPPGALTARFLGEAVPGRHLQSSLQEERRALPKYRRFLGSPAFIEGWKMYAVSLGEDLGVYRDVEGKFGALLVEMECAGTVTVDSGLHSLGWTRQQAIDYLHAQLPIDDARAGLLVDRAIAVPGYGLGCASSARFHALRLQAEKVLGSRFNLGAFDLALLQGGAIPLDLLEARMKRWQEAQASAAVTPDANVH